LYAVFRAYAVGGDSTGRVLSFFVGLGRQGPLGDF